MTAFFLPVSFDGNIKSIIDNKKLTVRGNKDFQGYLRVQEMVATMVGTSTLTANHPDLGQIPCQPITFAQSFYCDCHNHIDWLTTSATILELARPCYFAWFI